MTNQHYRLRTREQEFAATVYERVQQFDAQFPKNSSVKNDDTRKRYASLAHSLAILIRSAGLVQALAFAQRKQENSYFTEHLATALGYQNPLQLIEAAYSADLMEYMFLTEEVLAVLLWFKRFAQSILKIDQSEAQTDGGTVSNSQED